MMRTEDLAYGRITGTRLTDVVRNAAQSHLQRIGRSLQVLGAELARIPDYQDEAERRFRALRRGTQ